MLDRGRGIHKHNNLWMVSLLPWNWNDPQICVPGEVSLIYDSSVLINETNGKSPFLLFSYAIEEWTDKRSNLLSRLLLLLQEKNICKSFSIIFWLFWLQRFCEFHAINLLMVVFLHKTFRWITVNKELPGDFRLLLYYSGVLFYHHHDYSHYQIDTVSSFWGQLQ